MLSQMHAFAKPSPNNFITLISTTTHAHHYQLTSRMIHVSHIATSHTTRDISKHKIGKHGSSFEQGDGVCKMSWSKRKQSKQRQHNIFLDRLLCYCDWFFRFSLERHSCSYLIPQQSCSGAPWLKHTLIIFCIFTPNPGYINSFSAQSIPLVD